MERLQKIKECWSSGIISTSPLARVAIEDINELIQMVEQYQRQETILLGRLKKAEEKMFACNRKTKWQVYEENLKLHQELALLKGEMSG